MKISILAVALGAMLAASPAMAIDAVTLLVPVHFNNLSSDVQKVAINCQLKGINPNTGFESDLSGDNSDHVVYLPLTNGNYVGPSPVSVVFKTENFPSATDQLLLANPSTLSCQFSFVTATGNYVPYYYTTTPLLGHQAGTAFDQNAQITVPKK